MSGELLSPRETLSLSLGSCPYRQHCPWDWLAFKVGSVTQCQITCLTLCYKRKHRHNLHQSSIQGLVSLQSLSRQGQLFASEFFFFFLQFLETIQAVVLWAHRVFKPEGEDLRTPRTPQVKVSQDICQNSTRSRQSPHWTEAWILSRLYSPPELIAWK